MELNFYMPTKVIMGKDCICGNAALIKETGSRAMLVTGAHSAKNNGSLKDVTDTLDEAGLSYVIYDKVMSNPTIECVYRGAELAKQNQVDMIIGIGGGSPMDAAKAIALLAVQEVSEEELFAGKYKRQALPLIMVPTTAGTGSEVTPYSILTNDKAQTKTSVADPVLFPRISFLDAAYMKDMPYITTVNTALDALSHAVEGMLSVRASQVTDAIAQESIQNIAEGLADLNNPEYRNRCGFLPAATREKLLYGSMLAGIVIAHTGTTAVHSMGYSLTYFKNIDHGRANALLLPSFLRYADQGDSKTVQKILSAMKLDTLEEFENLFQVLLGDREQLNEDEIIQYSGIAIQAKNIQNSRIIPTREDLIGLYSRSLKA